MFCPKCGSKLKETVYETDLTVEEVQYLEETSEASAVEEKMQNADVYGFIVLPPVLGASGGSSDDIRARRYPSRQASPASRSWQGGASAVRGYHNVRK